MSSDLRRPPEGSALGLPATARAVRRLGALAMLTTACGAAALGCAVWWALAGDASGDGWGWAITALAVAALMVLGAGVVRLAAVVRMRRVLASRPWVACPCHMRETWPGQPPGSQLLVVVDPPGGGPSRVLAVTRRPGPDFRSECEAGGRVWLAGEPARGGVLSPPGGAQPVWGRPVGLRPLGRLAARRSRAHRHPATGTRPAGA